MYDKLLKSRQSFWITLYNYKLRVFHPVVPIKQFNIYCPPYTTQWCKVKLMQQLIQLHVSTPWSHLQAYKIWYHARYICCYYLRDPVVYGTLVIKMWYCKPQDPVGSNNRCTFYDTIFYKLENDSSGSKHVALLTLWRETTAIVVVPHR